MLGCMTRPSLRRLPHTKVELKMVAEGMLARLSCQNNKMTMAHRSASTMSAEVVISGGGLVGTAAAATIAKLGR